MVIEKILLNCPGREQFLKPMPNKKIFCALISLMFLSSSCIPSCKSIYKDDKVSVKEKSLVNILNVHASKDTITITVFGKNYEDVRGNPPYYLEIPGKDSILFVTGYTFDNGQATVHIVNLSTKQETNFPAYDSSIGEGICTTNSQTADWFEKIESINGDKLQISAAMTNRRLHYYLDLQKSEFEKEDGFYTNYTNTWVWPNGKNPNK